MPIRPDLRHHYRGRAWRETRTRILARAKNRCELCQVKNEATIERGLGGCWRSDVIGASWRKNDGCKTTWEPPLDSRRVVKIVLTIAHLNHVAGDDRDENLKALCQWCHLNYDKLHHRETRARRKDAGRPLLKEAM